MQKLSVAYLSFFKGFYLLVHTRQGAFTVRGFLPFLNKDTGLRFFLREKNMRKKYTILFI